MKRHGASRRAIETMVITLVVLLTFGGTGVLAQMRIVDQGNKPWGVYLCDTSGTNCVGTETTATAGVYRLLTSTSGGGAGGGTVAQGTNGSAAAPWYVTFTSGTVSVSTMPVVNVGTLPTVNVGTLPTVNVGTLPVVNVGTMPAVTGSMQVTNTTTTLPVSIRCEDATGTVFVPCGPTTVTASPTGTTTVTGTVQANAGTGTLNTVFATGTVTQLPAITGTVQANAGTGTLNVAIGNTGTVQANAGTGTLGMDLAKVLGAALTTANPVIGGGRASTDTTASVADGVARAFRLDKFGGVIITVAPPDMQSSLRAALTSTTASSMISAPGANYKFALTLLSACNLSATIAGQVDITDSSGTIYSFPWTQTSSAPGEPRCIIVNLGAGDPIFSAANSTISAKASVANGTGFTVNLALHKTGT